MCLNPIQRPNPNYHVQGIHTYVNNAGEVVKVPVHNVLSARISAQARAFGRDADNRFIYVPCGHCPECVAARQNDLVQRAEMESRYNHIFFATLTYDQKHLPILEIKVPVVPAEDSYGVDDAEGSSLFHEECHAPADSDFLEERLNQLASEDFDFDGLFEEVHERQEPDRYDLVRLPYADIHHVQLMMKNLRDNLLKDPDFLGRKISYIAVSELGKKNGRPHFHILFFITKKPGDIIDTPLSALSYSGLTGLAQGKIRTLESKLYKAVFKYWSINVGTRKNPVYEPLFTYRRRYYGQKAYTNFDLHYVDPRSTNGDTKNVAYYVTKYLMKGSDKERRRQQFLALNLDEAQYHEVWDTIKCRCTISKGFGLDCEFYTVDSPEPEYYTLEEYAKELDCDDLPPSSLVKSYRIRRKRIMVPNFDAASYLRSNLTHKVGEAPGPVYCDLQGHWRPLAHYYQRFGFIFTSTDALDIYLNYDDSEDIPSYMLSKQEKDELYQKHNKRLLVIDNNSSFDTSPALLWGTDTDDNNLTLDFHVS